MNRTWGLVFSAVVGAACSHTVPPSQPHQLADQPAPSFEAVATNRRDVAVPALGQTHVTVIDFWASWCATCRATVPTLSDLYDDQRHDGILVIGVSIDENPQAAEAFLASIGAKFPLVLDEHQQIAGAYGVQKVPLTFVIDGDARVRWVGRDPDRAAEAAEAVLQEHRDGRTKETF